MSFNREKRLEDDKMEPIAVIGFDARLPGEATSADGFWKMLSEGRSARTEIPQDRFNIDAFYHPDNDRVDTTNVRTGNFLTGDIAAFDAPFFSIQPAEVASMDPQQRLMLEASYRALENAGIPMESVAGTKSCVYVGTSSRDYEALLLRDPESPAKYLGTGIGTSMLANRVSWFFDLRGPSVALDTACSSGLSALHLACQSLRSHESNLGLVGGCSLILAPDVSMIHLSNMGFFSPDGRCYTFDDRANGYAKGEGAGVVVIKLLADALRDGDTIRAVIRATGANQDGKTPGLTQPSRTAQEQNILETYRAGGLDLGVTKYFEAHGTGTQVGDPIEARSISAAFQKSADEPLYVGAVKPNIGHLEAGSGVASLIKSILILEKALIPPNINFEKTNVNIPTDKWNIQFPTRLVPWPTKGLRRASVNSFGYGGSNAHCVLDDAYNYLNIRSIEGKHCTVRSPPHLDEGTQETHLLNGHILSPSPRPPKVLVWSTSDEEGLKRLATVYQEYMSERPISIGADMDRYMTDLSYTLSNKRSVLPWKAFAVASSSQELAYNLYSTMSKPVRSSTAPALSFVFTGQGAQWAGMGCDLRAFPVFEASLLKSEKCLQDLGSRWMLIDELEKEKNVSAIDDPALAQPLSTALQIALVDLLASWKIFPNAVVGHSSGEIAAAYCAGGLSHESALKVAFFRGALAGRLAKRSADPKAMASIAQSEQDIEPYLSAINKHPGRGQIAIGCVNAPNNVTVTGDLESVNALVRLMEEQGVFARKLQVNVAYHSSYMEEIANEYAELIADISPRSGPCHHQPAVFSSVTGTRHDIDDFTNRSYWVKNLVSRVRFLDALGQMSSYLSNQKGNRKGGRDLLIEVGPSAALQRPVKDTVKSVAAPENITYDSILKRDASSLKSYLEFVGRLWCSGYNVDLPLINASESKTSDLRLLVDLPLYPFNHSQSYWTESRLSTNFRTRKYARHELLGAPVADWNHLEPRWRNTIRKTENPWILDHKLGGSELYPAAGMIAMAVEGIRQLADPSVIITGYRLKDVVFNKALLISSTGDGVEAQLHFHRRKPATQRSFETNSFIVYGYLNDEWSSVCEGTVIMEHHISENEISWTQDSEKEQSGLKESFEAGVRRCTDSVNSKQFYKNLAAYGFDFGPTFQPLEKIKFNDTGDSTATIRLEGWKSKMANTGVKEHVIHPTALDGLGQLTMASFSKGSWDTIPTMVPTQFKSLWLSNSLLTRGQDAEVEVFARTTFQGYREADFSIIAFGQDGEAQIVVEGWRETALTSLDTTAAGEGALRCYHIEWKPDPALLDDAQVAAVCEKGMESKIPEQANTSRKTTTNSFLRTMIVVGPESSTQWQMASELRDSLQAVKKPSCDVIGLNNVRSTDLRHSECIFLVELDAPFLANMDGDGFLALKSMVATAGRILWVTRGSGERADRPEMGLVTGLGRTLISENSSIDFVELALEMVSSVAQMVRQTLKVIMRDSASEDGQGESEYLEKSGQLCIGRLVRDPPLTKSISAKYISQPPMMQEFGLDPSRGLELSIGSPGLLDTLRFKDDARVGEPLADDEVEIRVHATGMNFKDVMIALGQIPGNTLGFECAGLVARVGKSVQLKPGERVLCCTTTGAFNTFVRAHATSVAAIPDGMSLTSAAALPTVFCTAHYSLFKLAHLQEGESILIHSGAGGVGQAAIQLAKLVNANIFTTVGTEEKKRFVMERYEIPERHIFSSRDASFVSALLEQIEGVDVVLNSLSGDLLRASWSCIAPFGRFIELGKSDMGSRDGLPMSPFAQNVMFASVDLGLVMDKAKKVMGATLKAVMELFAARPQRVEVPRVNVYKLGEIEKAFRSLQSGKSIGKTVVEMDADYVVPVIPSSKPTYSFDSDATYVIAGGLGGLGRSITRWMASWGAKHFILLSRSGAVAKDALELTEEMRMQGVNISAPICDITDEGAVAAVIRDHERSMPQIRGCIQASMVLRDGLFENSTLEDFNAAIRPKVQGSWNLHTHLPANLDFFLLLSSISGVAGSRAQANYAAGNTYKNALARHRVARGQKCISLDLGPVLSTGVVAENDLSAALEQVGFQSVGKNELFALLDHCCDPDLPLPGNPWESEIVTSLGGAETLPAERVKEIYWTRKPLFSILAQADRAESDTSSSSNATAIDYASLIKAAPSQSAAEEIVVDALKQKLAKDLGVPVGDIDGEKAVYTLGIDSLVAVELRSWFKKEMGAEVAIFDIMKGQSLRELGGWVAGRCALKGS